MNLIEDKNGVNLCYCNNCDSVLINENPQTDAKVYEAGEAKQMIAIHDYEGHYWACPVCLTDDYLRDL